MYLYKSFTHLKTTHSYHLVDPSPWPIVAAFAAFMFTTGGVLYMQRFIGGWSLFFTGFIALLYVMYTWWRDVVREATFEDTHTVVVQKGLRLGMILFIVSEVMFFFAFFWAFFHSSVAPVYNLGGVWPPKGITTINTYTVPLTNTFFLLASAATVTWANHAIIARAKKHTIIALIFTLTLASFFIVLQGLEYLNAPFNISDGVYGSCFYMITGFHGFHVFVGLIALFISFIRVILNHFTNKHHFGFESAIWYWHFVDVVWLFLFITVYWWGNNVPDSNLSIIPLSSTGRVSVINWLINSDFIVMYSYIFVDFILLFASWVIFILLYSISTQAKISINDFLKFSTNLPLINKYLLFIFTLVFAIPNRIFINNGLNFYLTGFIVTLLFLLTKISPFITLPLVFYLLLAIESVVFAFFYENASKIFKTYLDNILFGGNPQFAQQYFKFFWGNMDKAGKSAIKTGAVGWLVRIGWNTVTELEDRHAQEEAERRVARAAQSAYTPTSAPQIMKMTEMEKYKIMEKKAPFSTAEALLKQKLREASDRALAEMNKPRTG